MAPWVENDLTITEPAFTAHFRIPENQLHTLPRRGHLQKQAEKIAIEQFGKDHGLVVDFVIETF
jgi:hypothetical protein